MSISPTNKRVSFDGKIDSDRDLKRISLQSSSSAPWGLTERASVSSSSSSASSDLAERASVSFKRPRPTQSNLALRNLKKHAPTQSSSSASSDLAGRVTTISSKKRPKAPESGAAPQHPKKRASAKNCFLLPQFSEDLQGIVLSYLEPKDWISFSKTATYINLSVHKHLRGTLSGACRKKGIPNAFIEKLCPQDLWQLNADFQKNICLVLKNLGKRLARFGKTEEAIEIVKTLEIATPVNACSPNFYSNGVFLEVALFSARTAADAQSIIRQFHSLPTRVYPRTCSILALDDDIRKTEAAIEIANLTTGATRDQAYAQISDSLAKRDGRGLNIPAFFDRIRPSCPYLLKSVHHNWLTALVNTGEKSAIDFTFNSMQRLIEQFGTTTNDAFMEDKISPRNLDLALKISIASIEIGNTNKAIQLLINMADKVSLVGLPTSLSKKFARKFIEINEIELITRETNKLVSNAGRQNTLEKVFRLLTTCSDFLEDAPAIHRLAKRLPDPDYESAVRGMIIESPSQYQLSRLLALIPRERIEMRDIVGENLSLIVSRSSDATIKKIVKTEPSTLPDSDAHDFIYKGAALFYASRHDRTEEKVIRAFEFIKKIENPHIRKNATGSVFRIFGTIKAERFQILAIEQAKNLTPADREYAFTVMLGRARSDKTREELRELIREAGQE